MSFGKSVEKKSMNELLEITEIGFQEIRIFYRGMLIGGEGKTTSVKLTVKILNIK